MHNVLCDSQADPTPTPKPQFMFKIHWNLNSINREDWDHFWLRRHLGHVSWKNRFANPCRGKLIYQYAGHPPHQHILADRSGTESILSPGFGLTESTLLHAIFSLSFRKGTRHNNLLSKQLHHLLGAWHQKALSESKKWKLNCSHPQSATLLDLLLISWIPPALPSAEIPTTLSSICKWLWETTETGFCIS